MRSCQAAVRTCSVGSPPLPPLAVRLQLHKCPRYERAARLLNPRPHLQRRLETRQPGIALPIGICRLRSAPGVLMRCQAPAANSCLAAVVRSATAPLAGPFVAPLTATAASAAAAVLCRPATLPAAAAPLPGAPAPFPAPFRCLRLRRRRWVCVTPPVKQPLESVTMLEHLADIPGCAGTELSVSKRHHLTSLVEMAALASHI